MNGWEKLLTYPTGTFITNSIRHCNNGQTSDIEFVPCSFEFIVKINKSSKLGNKFFKKPGLDEKCNCSVTGSLSRIKCNENFLNKYRALINA